MSREFDRYFVHVDAGTEEKFATLSDAEYRAHIVGVLAVAAKSPMRGYLFVGELEAQPVHIARRAGVSERVAASAMRKLKEVGVLVRDEEVGAWRVHNWEKHQSERRDPTAAKRAADYRARRSASRKGSRDPSRDGSPDERDESRSPSREARESLKGLEVEKEEETPPNPPASQGGTTFPSRPVGNRKTALAAFEADCARFAGEHFPAVPTGLVAHFATQLRSRGAEPTVDALTRLIEQHTKGAAA